MSRLKTLHLFRDLVDINLRQHVRWISSTMCTRHENANQHHGTEKLHYPVVCIFLVGRCCCLFAVGRLLVVCLLYVCCEFGLVGWLSQPNTDANCQLCLHIHQTPRWTTHKKKDDVNGESRVNNGVEKVQ